MLLLSSLLGPDNAPAALPSAQVASGGPAEATACSTTPGEAANLLAGSGVTAGGVTAGGGSNAVASGLASFDFFSNYGSYMPRVHCLQKADGSPDWLWIGIYGVTLVAIVGGYLKMFFFWRRQYRAEKPEDRNTKLMDLAYIFLWCAVCGYGMSLVLLFWPGYRLLVVFHLILIFFTWRFVYSIDDLKVSLSAKRLHRELVESYQNRAEELEKLVTQRTAELNQARLEAEASGQAKSQFLANMSHEIRTPMTAILGFTDLLADTHLSEARRGEHIDTIRRNGQHLINVVNDILDLSKIEAGKMPVERVPCDAVRIAEEVVELLTPKATEKGLSLVIERKRPLEEQILGDPMRIRQVLMNLLGNALKFTNAGRVVIRLSGGQGLPTDVLASDAAVVETPGIRPIGPKDPYLRIDVIDSGQGMNEETLVRLFTPFSQADASTTRRYGGTGLGLTIVKRLTEMMGGAVGVGSVPGKGSTFSIYLPATPTQRAPAQQARPTITSGDRPATNTIPRLDGLQVLLAEDGPDNQRLLCHLLERSGAKVRMASNGREAVEEAMAHNPDVVLMDMQMPELDGYGATAELRRRGYGRPIIALTAHAMAGDEAKCLAAGCDAYATKPIDWPALRMAVAELGKASQPA
ncbi:MAG: ATP-binding protein [Phycisphaerae bacterium]